MVGFQLEPPRKPVHGVRMLLMLRAHTLKYFWRVRIRYSLSDDDIWTDLVEGSFPSEVAQRRVHDLYKLMNIV